MENHLTCIGVSLLQHALGPTESFRWSFPVKCSDVLRDKQEKSPLMQFHLPRNESVKASNSELSILGN